MFIFVKIDLLIRKKLISIESRGLRDGAGEPLSKYIPQKSKVRPIEIILDLRQKG